VLDGVVIGAVAHKSTEQYEIDAGVHELVFRPSWMVSEALRFSCAIDQRVIVRLRGDGSRSDGWLGWDIRTDAGPRGELPHFA
jgi:hypothetical protein